MNLEAAQVRLSHLRRRARTHTHTHTQHLRRQLSCASVFKELDHYIEKTVLLAARTSKRSKSDLSWSCASVSKILPSVVHLPFSSMRSGLRM